jgi:hypothetical protein
MLSWLNGRKTGVEVIFDGTFRRLLDVYQTDKQSSYKSLKRSSRLPYDVYIRMMRAEIGERLIDGCDGRDVARWFEAWSSPAIAGERRQVAKARMAIAVLRQHLLSVSCVASLVVRSSEPLSTPCGSRACHRGNSF